MTAEVLRRAANVIEEAVSEAEAKGHRYARIAPSDHGWPALPTVPLAAALAAWLRAEAACIDSTADVAEHMPKVLDGIEEHLTGQPARGHTLRVSLSTATEAVAVARAILEEPS